MVVDYCDSGPCPVTSTCESITYDFGYKCHCPYHLQGTHCGIEIDPCASFPCKNQAICSKNGAGDYKVVLKKCYKMTSSDLFYPKKISYYHK